MADWPPPKMHFPFKIPFKTISFWSFRVGGLFRMACQLARKVHFPFEIPFEIISFWNFHVGGLFRMTSEALEDPKSITFQTSGALDDCHDLLWKG